MDLSVLLRESDLGHFLTMSLMTPLGVPATLILIDKWRLQRRALWALVGGLAVFLTGYFIAVFHFLGATTPAIILGAVGTPVFCWAAYFIAAPFRDGRLLFTVFTAFLLALATEIFANVLAPRGTPLWLILKVLLTAAELALLYRFGRKPYKRMVSTADVGWLKMSLLPFLMVVSMGRAFMSPLPRRMGADVILAVSLNLLALCIYIAFNRLIELFKAQLRSSGRTAALQSQMRFMEEQTGMMLAAERDNRTFRHDLRHYTGLLRGCLEAGNLTGAREILDSLDANMDGLFATASLHSHTGAPIIDTMLSLKAGQAAEAGADCSIQMEMPEELLADSVELAVVLSNAMENAIQACRAQPPGERRAISVQGRRQGQQYYLCITNTTGGKVVFDAHSGLPVSGKKGHGYGTLSISAYAEERGGVLHYAAEDGRFSLSLLVPLPAAEPAE